jgi:hypothetical protein
VLVVGRVDIVEKEGWTVVVFWGTLASAMVTLGRGSRVVLEDAVWDVAAPSAVDVSIVVWVRKTRLVVVMSWSSAPSDVVETMSAASTFCVGPVLIAIVWEGITSFESSAIQN